MHSTLAKGTASCPIAIAQACSRPSRATLPAAIRPSRATLLDRSYECTSLSKRRVHLRPRAQLDDRLEDDDLDLNEEDIESILEVSSASKEENVIYWADYMEANVEGVQPISTTAEDETVSSSSIALPLRAGSQAAALKVAEEENMSPRLNLDPLMDTSSVARFFGGTSLPIRVNPGPMTEWDLRASMEKRRRIDAERAAWMDNTAQSIGRYTAVASDWRTDVRIKDTGDPTQAEYREWTLREIWDLITLGGQAMDPRDVPHKISELGTRTDFVAEGFVQQMDIPEWLAAQGRIIDDDNEDEVVDRDAEMALLASEFSDFDDFGVAEPLADPIDDGFGGEF